MKAIGNEMNALNAPRAPHAAFDLRRFTGERRRARGILLSQKKRVGLAELEGLYCQSQVAPDWGQVCEMEQKMPVGKREVRYSAPCMNCGQRFETGFVGRRRKFCRSNNEQCRAAAHRARAAFRRGEKMTKVMAMAGWQYVKLCLTSSGYNDIPGELDAPAARRKAIDGAPM